MFPPTAKRLDKSNKINNNHLLPRTLPLRMPLEESEDNGSRSVASSSRPGDVKRPTAPLSQTVGARRIDARR